MQARGKSGQFMETLSEGGGEVQDDRLLDSYTRGPGFSDWAGEPLLG